MNNGAVSALGVGANRDDVQFFDLDGDGLADYIWVHPEDGSVEVWFNDGPLGDALGWSVLFHSTCHDEIDTCMADLASTGFMEA